MIILCVLRKKVPLSLTVLSRPELGDLEVLLKLLLRNGWLTEETLSSLETLDDWPSLLDARGILSDILRPIWETETLRRKSGRGTGLIECLRRLNNELSESSKSFQNLFVNVVMEWTQPDAWTAGAGDTTVDWFSLNHNLQLDEKVLMLNFLLAITVWWSNISWNIAFWLSSELFCFLRDPFPIQWQCWRVFLTENVCHISMKMKNQNRTS